MDVEGGREEWDEINEYWVHKATNAIIRNLAFGCPRKSRKLNISAAPSTQLFYATKNDRKKYAQSDKHKSQPQNKDVVAEQQNPCGGTTATPLAATQHGATAFLPSQGLPLGVPYEDLMRIQKTSVSLKNESVVIS